MEQTLTVFGRLHVLTSSWLCLHDSIVLLQASFLLMASLVLLGWTYWIRPQHHTRRCRRAPLSGRRWNLTMGARFEVANGELR